MSCSNSDEKIIKEYMSANMNDPSSYESIELKVINNDTSILSQLPEIQEKLIKLNDLYERNSNLCTDYIMAVFAYRADSLDNLVKQQSEYKKISENEPLSFMNYSKFSEIQKKLLSELRSEFEKTPKRKDNQYYLLELQAQSEGIANRIEVEELKLKDIFKSYGIMNPEKALFQLQYNKYRGKNAFGALVIIESVFIIDKNSKKVVKVYNLN